MIAKWITLPWVKHATIHVAGGDPLLVIDIGAALWASDTQHDLSRTTDFGAVALEN